MLEKEALSRFDSLHDVGRHLTILPQVLQNLSVDCVFSDLPSWPIVALEWL